MDEGEDWQARALAAEEKLRQLAEYLPDLRKVRDLLQEAEARIPDLKAAAVELERIPTMEEALRAAAGQFRSYEQHHRAKGPGPENHEKAERNRQMAEMCEAAAGPVGPERVGRGTTTLDMWRQRALANENKAQAWDAYRIKKAGQRLAEINAERASVGMSPMEITAAEFADTIDFMSQIMPTSLTRDA